MKIIAIALIAALLVTYSLAGEPYSVGENHDRQLGDGTQSNSVNLVKVLGAVTGKNITTIISKIFLNVALDSDGKIYSWGINQKHALGSGSNTYSAVSVSVKGLDGKLITDVACGYLHGLALSADNKVFTWGDNEKGQSTSVGDGTVARTIDSLNGLNIIAVSAGDYHSLVLAR
jgi:alpha-tubulin suppressor-like RCC1 family protein